MPTSQLLPFEVVMSTSCSNFASSPCYIFTWSFIRFGSAPMAVDGVAFLPMRLLGTSLPSDSCGNATTPTCVLANLSTDPTYSATRIQCVVPPGVGLGFQMLIRETWTSLVPNGVRVGYSAPTVASVSPPLLPALGGEVTLSGTGFGPGPCDDVNERLQCR